MPSGRIEMVQPQNMLVAGLWVWQIYGSQPRMQCRS